MENESQPKDEEWKFDESSSNFGTGFFVGALVGLFLGVILAFSSIQDDESQSHFDEIKSGDTITRVRDIMGNPDSFHRTEDGTQVFWEYDNEGKISFFLNRVDSKESSVFNQG